MSPPGLLDFCEVSAISCIENYRLCERVVLGCMSFIGFYSYFHELPR